MKHYFGNTKNFIIKQEEKNHVNTRVLSVSADMGLPTKQDMGLATILIGVAVFLKLKINACWVMAKVAKSNKIFKKNLSFS